MHPEGLAFLYFGPHSGSWAMMTIVAFLVFGIALAVALTVIVHTLAPAMPRIIALLSGQDVATTPQLVLRDRRPAPRPRLAPQSRSAHRVAA